MSGNTVQGNPDALDVSEPEAAPRDAASGVKQCPACGALFSIPLHVAWRPSRLYCADPVCTKRRAADRTRRIWNAFPQEKRIEKAHRNYVNSGGAAQKRYYLKHRRVPCTRCGIVRMRADLKDNDRLSYLCGKCKKNGRLAARVQLPCRYCGEPAGITNDKYIRSECTSCYGVLTQIGNQLGLTRERIRQLVVKEMQHGASRSEAVEIVKQKRGLR